MRDDIAADGAEPAVAGGLARSDPLGGHRTGHQHPREQERERTPGLAPLLSHRLPRHSQRDGLERRQQPGLQGGGKLRTVPHGDRRPLGREPCGPAEGGERLDRRSLELPGALEFGRQERRPRAPAAFPTAPTCVSGWSCAAPANRRCRTCPRRASPRASPGRPQGWLRAASRRRSRRAARTRGSDRDRPARRATPSSRRGGSSAAATTKRTPNGARSAPCVVSCRTGSRRVPRRADRPLGPANGRPMSSADALSVGQAVSDGRRPASKDGSRLATWWRERTDPPRTQPEHAEVPPGLVA